MKNRYILYFALLSMILFACDEDKVNEAPLKKKENAEIKTSLSDVAENPNVVKGIIKIKLQRNIGDNIAVNTKGNIVQSNVTPLNTLLGNIRATGMRRLFPYAGKYEKRTRKAGLHLWYVVNFDPKVAVSTAVFEAQKIKDIEIVERQFKVIQPNNDFTEAQYPTPNADEKSPFDDPLLKDQWHYYNNGSLPSSIKGADINLFKAWEIEVGKPNVIVDIVDGGVDFRHKDLKDNMYINEAEMNGQAGVDDDNNGYVDDIYGYNFFSNKGTIVPQPHGTHVAGTVAARNNNGVGVCGIAGGDGTPNSGIRLMSSQVFQGNRGGGMEEALKYGADNGAVISQNSWGYPYPGPGEISGALKDAIDYFVKYAGCDNEGNQLADSPMKGGVVIFAAGNDDIDFLDVPAYYEPVVAVAAMAPNFKKASYSTYGNWVDITAPGGDGIPYGVKSKVYSTIPGNKYGYMNGTSMACPHVSGIAALIASKFGGPGFTNDDLKKRLLTGLRPYNVDKLNPKYVGKLGAGYIDAYAVLFDKKDNVAPETPKFSKVTPDFTRIKVEWKAIADKNDTSPIAYRVYYSNEKLNKDNYKNATQVKINAFGYEVGAPISYQFRYLELNTKYYFAIEAVDRWDAVSGVSFTEGKTKENHAPIITRTDNTPIRITKDQRAELKLLIKDPDKGQKWFVGVSGHKRGVTPIKQADGLLLKFRVVGELGKFSLRVVVSDIYDGVAEMEIPFEYYQDEPPVVSKEIDKVYAPINKAYTIDLNKHFSDPENLKLTYTAKSKRGSAKATINDNILSITPNRFGQGKVEVTATDKGGNTVSTTFEYQAVKDDIVYIVYPIPVKKILNVRLSNEVNTAKLSIRTVTGKSVLDKKVNVNSKNRLVKLNLSDLSGGTFVLYAEANGKTYKQTFVKY